MVPSRQCLSMVFKVLATVGTTVHCRVSRLHGWVPHIGTENDRGLEKGIFIRMLFHGHASAQKAQTLMATNHDTKMK